MNRGFIRPPMALVRTGLFAAVALASLSTSAQAVTVTLADNYFGGLNGYNNPNDIIGDASEFDTTSAVIKRVGAGGNTLEVTINTAFAGQAGLIAGVGYGALFFNPTWSPTGVAPYDTDVYQAGDWKYAFTIPQTPGPGDQSGTGDLYLTGLGNLGALTPGFGTIQPSNVNGNPISAPNPGNPGYYFRQDQAVQFTPDSQASSLGTGTWSVNSSLDQITFDIVDNHLLGSSFALSWAMTCANDVLQGMVSGVPEPGTWIMMILGFGMIGGAMRRKIAAEAKSGAATA